MERKLTPVLRRVMSLARCAACQAETVQAVIWARTLLTIDAQARLGAQELESLDAVWFATGV